jgi:hypothetical protein
MCQLYVIKKPEWLRKNLSSEEKVLRNKRKKRNKDIQQYKAEEMDFLYHIPRILVLCLVNVFLF